MARAAARLPRWPLQACGAAGSSPWLVGVPPAVGWIYGFHLFMVPVFREDMTPLNWLGTALEALACRPGELMPLCLSCQGGCGQCPHSRLIIGGARRPLEVSREPLMDSVGLAA